MLSVLSRRDVRLFRAGRLSSIAKRHRPRYFKTTPRRQNPFLVRIAAVVAGRAARWWVKEKMKGVPLKQRRMYYAGGLAAFLGISTVGGGIYYYVNLVPCPITGRLQFITTDRKYELEMASDISKQQALGWQQSGIKVLAHTDPRTMRVARIASQLIKALPQLQLALEVELAHEVLDTMSWSVTVVDANVANAHVLPNGEIYVFTGLLDLVGDGKEGDARLANVMGHEISHALLRHGGERISKSQLVLFAQSALSFVVWALVPDGVFEFLHIRAILGLEGLQQSILNIVLALPNTRAQETEADYLGLLLSSAACYDPSQAPVLWEKFAAMNAQGEAPEILSTHPHSLKRAENLEGWQKDAYEIRSMCNCGPIAKAKKEHSHHHFSISSFFGSGGEHKKK
mmetsp:Transcript_39322/g.76342  ORF Transcript_39322/g.76342 Transcript_39322/m.76342 type:complete len:399 (+) Transcript_39322:68-1264(+)